MTHPLNDRLHIWTSGIKQPIGPDDAEMRARYEALIRADYNHLHKDDSFDDLKRRARFSKEDKGLLSLWMRVAAGRAEQSGPVARRAHDPLAV
tara:strand:+ start:117 stop:395 length:279 start_codon:yes stop_codon:yes gene_type:complete